MKTVYLNAYVRGNLGDDLFIYRLCKRYKNTRFIIEGEKRYKKMLRFKNLIYLSNDTLLYRLAQYFLARVCNSDVSTLLTEKCCYKVMCQGSAFQGEPVIRVHLIKDFFQDSYVIGVNFGPYKNDCYRLQMRAQFEKAKDVCFRDRASYYLFRDLPNVRYAPDILLGMHFPAAPGKNYVVVSVMDFQYASRPYEVRKYAAVYECALCSLCVNIIRKLQTDVVLMSFCEAEGDLAAARRVRTKMIAADRTLEEKVSIFNHQNLLESVQMLNESRAVLATRFHSMVLAWRMNKPCFAVCYGQKMRNLISDFSFKNFCTLEKLEELKPESVVCALAEGINPDIRTAGKQAQGHFAKLDKVLGEKNREGSV